MPLNFETAVKNFSNSDVWLSCNFNSIEELFKADSKHNLFNPVKKGKVYNFNKKMLPSGANDFWESAVVRPDILLTDVISVLHPEILPVYESIYMNKLKCYSEHFEAKKLHSILFACITMRNIFSVGFGFRKY